MMYSQIEFARRGWFDFHRDFCAARKRNDPKGFDEYHVELLANAPKWVGKKTKARFDYWATSFRKRKYPHFKILRADESKSEIESEFWEFFNLP
jgi:hypothetical protein